MYRLLTRLLIRPGNALCLVTLLLFPGLSFADLFEEVTVARRFFKAPETYPTFNIKLDQPARIQLLVYNWEGELVHAGERSAEAKSHHLILASLPKSKHGSYLFCLVAADQHGKRLGLFPIQADGGEIIKIRESRLNAEAKTIDYVLPRAAFLRIRAGFPEGPYLTPVLPWTPQTAGRHQVSWDGTGSGGVFKNLYQNPRTQVVISAVALPQNHLVDESQLAKPLEVAKPHLDLAQAPPDLQTYPRTSLNQTFERHADMAVGPDFQLLMAAEYHAKDQTVILQVDCPTAERGRLLNKRFEIMLFIDAFFVMEDERGLLPFNYRMSTRGLVPGQHILTVNVIDSDGRMGAVSQEILIKN